MTTSRLKQIIIVLALIVAMNAGTIALAEGDATTAGTLISNQARGEYADEAGNNFSTVSPMVSVAVRPVSALVVTPDEREASAGVGARERITRSFRICNAGNAPDSYTIASFEISAPATLVELRFDTDASNTLTEADRVTRVGETSAQLAPGECAGVLAVFDTNNATTGSLITLRLTARSNAVSSANGGVEDTGTIINRVGDAARFTAPMNTALPPVKLVENRAQVVATANDTLTYAIIFRNSGGTAARGVRVVDELPQNLRYVAGSLRLNTRPLTDANDADEGYVAQNRIEVRLREVAVDEIIQINFQAALTGEIASGAGVVNTAKITSDNTETVTTSEAIAIVNPFGTVYAGYSAGGAPIAGASVKLLSAQDGDALTTLQAQTGFTPNEANANPFTTDGQGYFSFHLATEQRGANGAPVRYFLSVTAPGYRARMLELTILPAGENLLTATVRALDNQPVARAGSYLLTNDAVSHANLASLAFNVPMFEFAALEITKSADRPQADIGDIVSYRIEARNATAAGMTDVRIEDTPPAGFIYAEGTARLQSQGDAGSQGRAIEPEQTAGKLVFRIGKLERGASATITYRLRIGANARTGEQVNTAVSFAAFASGEAIQSAEARATVRVGRGVFSLRQMIIGRVFEDANGNNVFDKDERPLAGVRLYLNNGQSVVTDSAGQYNLPAIAEGATVISLDPVTVPAGFKLADDRRRSGRSWTRLLTTPLGGGALFRQNFALRPTGEDLTAQTNAATTSANLSRLQETKTANAPQEQEASARVASSKTLPRTAPTNAEVRAGTYEEASTEVIAPVAAGDVVLLSPAADEVIMTPALSLEARVAANWTVQVEVNGERVNDTSIGVRRLDHKNRVATFGYVGINLRPGQNRIVATAVDAEGKPGKSAERIVMGRGAVKRLVVTPERGSVQAGGRESVAVRVQAFDAWGNPAVDAPIVISTSAGRFVSSSAKDSTARSEVATSNADEKESTARLTDGEAVVRLAANGTATGVARIRANANDAEAEAEVRFTPEVRPTIMVGLAEASFGAAAPQNQMRGDNSNVSSRIAFFYRGRIFGDNLLTLAYDSQRALNRTGSAGRGDRLFQLDPLDRMYPLFGDSSMRYEDAQSNSKLYARLDRGRSYAMFGDFTADMENLNLSGYARKLTGIKLHAENASGDFVTVTGARPDTSFARDTFPGGVSSLIRLSNIDVLPGSETIVLEVRDRRNPEIILSREPLARSVDYNLDPATGQIFFLRPISTFDYNLNLLQIVATYEYRANSLSSAVYTARAQKRFAGAGLRLGLSFINQRQDTLGSFMLGGIDGEQRLPRGGRLRFELAMSRGRVASTGNMLGSNTDASGEHNGNAVRLDLEQPLPFYEGVLRAGFTRATGGFLNPFGSTVVAGAQRTTVNLELKPRSSRTLRFGFTDERNRTANVDNSRQTASIGWTETWSEQLRTTVAYDFRRFTDSVSDREVNSNLLTIGAEYRPTNKLQFAIKREQNFGAADPTYPNQTTLSANYQVNTATRLFFTQRLASAPIVPIADTTGSGFAATNSRRETAFGVETKFGRYTNFSSRYQLENGATGTDSFAVVGLQNRLPVSKTLQLELGFERGFHLAGEGKSFNNAIVGVSWQPTENFRSSARYELRDRNGFGQLLTIGAAGRIGDNVTALARLQWGSNNFGGRSGSSLNGTAAVAFRPLRSDRAALLFSYTRRSTTQGNSTGASSGTTRDRSDTLSADGLWQATKNLEIYSRFALKFSANEDNARAFASALTYLVQTRAQQRLNRFFDAAGEVRFVNQPVSNSRRMSFGAEVGFWALPDLRLGGGYNFTTATEGQGAAITPSGFGARRGFYFTISSKLSNLFNLFGTSREGLAPADNATDETRGGEKR